MFLATVFELAPPPGVAPGVLPLLGVPVVEVVSVLRPTDFSPRMN